MIGAREAGKRGAAALDAGLALTASALRHVGWWLRWQTDRHSYREVTELAMLRPAAADAERPAA
jgi:hypothetical protein